MTLSASRNRLTIALRSSSDDLLRYFLSRLDSEDAADALAEVMATAWRRVDALPSRPEEARMWLFGIARNVRLHVDRGAIRRARLASRLREALTVHAAPPADAGVEIRDAIRRLEDDHAELIRLVHWDGFSIAEAAEILEIPPSTARGRYQKAKEVLRAALSTSTTTRWSASQ